MPAVVIPEEVHQARASAPGPLDLHEELSAGGCPRWPEKLRLQSTLGQLVPGRCRCTNLCDYCAKLAALENSELLQLDALRGEAPQVWAVLTTPRTEHDQAAYYRAHEAVRRAMRRIWPAYRAAALLEFTTGYGTGSGGLRRPHWNLMIKGGPTPTPDDVGQVLDVVETEWCPRVDGSIDAQHVGTINEAGGLMRYLALHFQKESQSPPEGWTGQRFNAMRGYLWTDTPTAREEARRSLRLKRELWKLRHSGLPAEIVNELAERAVYEAGELAWELVRLQELPTEFGDDGMPAAWTTEVVPVGR